MFKRNDIVSAFGVQGKVLSVEDGEVAVEFTDGNEEVFGLDGKLAPWHAGAVLTLVKRAVEPKTIRGWVNIYAGGKLGKRIHESKTLAIQKAAADDGALLATIEVTGQYQG